jgi:subtilisin family serine protease
MICKVLDQTNSGFYTWWIDAIYYAVDNGAKVINMSLGGSGTSASMLSAVSYAHANDVVIVASMMNFDNSAVYYPVGFPTTIAVGSTDANDQRSSPFFWSATSGSSYGNHIDIVAPGNFIYGLSHQSNSNYNAYWGGTSQAAPLVSGVCALLLAQNPSLTPTAIRTILRNSAEDQVGDPNEDVPGFDIYHGYGRLNAYQALLANSVGATELDELSELTVFPNPSSTELRIKAVSLEGDLRIVNMQGAVVYRQTGLKGSWEVNINIGEWPKGIYVVAVSDENGQWQKSTRIIVE